MIEYYRLMTEIQSCLTEDLLKKEFKITTGNKLSGHCYVATEALYYLLPNNIQEIFKPSTLKVNGVTHWFLRNIINNEILDPTAPQFDFELDYTKSRRSAFLTQVPSKRCLILINRINETNCN